MTFGRIKCIAAWGIFLACRDARGFASMSCHFRTYGGRCSKERRHAPATSAHMRPHPSVRQTTAKNARNFFAFCPRFCSTKRPPLFVLILHHFRGERALFSLFLFYSFIRKSLHQVHNRRIACGAFCPLSRPFSVFARLRENIKGRFSRAVFVAKRWVVEYVAARWRRDCHIVGYHARSDIRAFQPL